MIELKEKEKIYKNFQNKMIGKKMNEQLYKKN